MPELDEVFWEKANILIEYTSEATGYEVSRASLDWSETPSENASINALDEFILESRSIIGALVCIKDELISEEGVTDEFVSQVNEWWDELCKLYAYEGTQTFDGDLDTFLEFLGVTAYEDMGLSRLSLETTNFNLRDDEE